MATLLVQLADMDFSVCCAHACDITAYIMSKDFPVQGGQGSQKKEDENLNQATMEKLMYI